MSVRSRKTHDYEVNAILMVSKQSEQAILDTLSRNCGILRRVLHSSLHLTVYHGRRHLPGLADEDRAVRIVAAVVESRFMVMAPGGENPKPGIDPRQRSIGIRLTKRNLAIEAIQELRAQVYQFETPQIVGRRAPTTAWNNCFGARHYQPHITLIRPGHKVDRDLTTLGADFRAELQEIEFDRFKIVQRARSSKAFDFPHPQIHRG